MVSGRMSRQEGKARLGLFSPCRQRQGQGLGRAGSSLAALNSCHLQAPYAHFLHKRMFQLKLEDGEHWTWHTIPQLGSDLRWPGTQPCHEDLQKPSAEA